MAVTIKRAELSAALRLGHSGPEMAETTRLLAYATAGGDQARSNLPRRNI